MHFKIILIVSNLIIYCAMMMWINLPKLNHLINNDLIFLLTMCQVVTVFTSYTLPLHIVTGGFQEHNSIDKLKI